MPINVMNLRKMFKGGMEQGLIVTLEEEAPTAEMKLEEQMYEQVMKETKEGMIYKMMMMLEFRTLRIETKIEG